MLSKNAFAATEKHENKLRKKATSEGRQYNSKIDFFPRKQHLSADGTPLRTQGRVRIKWSFHFLPHTQKFDFTASVLFSNQFLKNTAETQLLLSKDDLVMRKMLQDSKSKKI